MSSNIAGMYKDMGAMLGYVISTDGHLTSIAGKSIKVNNLSLKLPLPENLDTKKMEEGKYLIYHPAHENITMLHSLIVRGLVKSVNHYYDLTYSTFLKKFIVLLNNWNKQEDLSPAQQTKLGGYPTVTKADVNCIKTLLKNTGPSRLVSLNMKDDHTPKDSEVSYKRAVTVTCPLHRMLKRVCTDKIIKIGGVKISKKFAVSLIDILEQVFPWVVDTTSVSGFGTCEGAPSIRALLATSTHLANCYNATCGLVKETPIDTSFVTKPEYKDITKFLTMVKTIPLQIGNEGGRDKNSTPTVELPQETVEAAPVVVAEPLPDTPIITPLPDTEVSGSLTPPWQVQAPVEVVQPPAPVAAVVQQQPPAELVPTPEATAAYVHVPIPMKQPAGHVQRPVHQPPVVQQQPMQQPVQQPLQPQRGIQPPRGYVKPQQTFPAHPQQQPQGFQQPQYGTVQQPQAVYPQQGHPLQPQQQFAPQQQGYPQQQQQFQPQQPPNAYPQPQQQQLQPQQGYTQAPTSQASADFRNNLANMTNPPQQQGYPQYR